jgi:hypothetical protein
VPLKPSDPVERTLEFIECINKADRTKLQAMISEDQTFRDGSGEIHEGRSLMI